MSDPSSHQRLCDSMAEEAVWLVYDALDALDPASKLLDPRIAAQEAVAVLVQRGFLRLRERGMTPDAYYSERERCWYVPVSGVVLEEAVPVEPVRVEFRDKQLLITRLDPSGQRLYAFTDEEAEALLRATGDGRLPDLDVSDAELSAVAKLREGSGAPDEETPDG